MAAFKLNIRATPLIKLNSLHDYCFTILGKINNGNCLTPIDMSKINKQSNIRFYIKTVKPLLCGTVTTINCHQSLVSNCQNQTCLVWGF